MEDLLGFSQEDFGLGFDAAVHLGTLSAILIYFRAIVASLIVGWLASLRSLHWDISSESRTAWLLLLGTLPAGVIGFLVEDVAQNTFRSSALIALMLILFSVPLVLAERLRVGQRSTSEARPRDAVLLGLAQSMALVPGVSRSGITISTAMALGFRRADAASFTFLLSGPIVAAAGGKQIFDVLRSEHSASLTGELGLYAVGLVSAGTVGYAAISLLVRYLRVNSLHIFVAYRLALGSVLLALWIL